MALKAQRVNILVIQFFTVPDLFHGTNRPSLQGTTLTPNHAVVRRASRRSPHRTGRRVLATHKLELARTFAFTPKHAWRICGLRIPKPFSNPVFRQFTHTEDGKNLSGLICGDLNAYLAMVSKEGLIVKVSSGGFHQVMDKDNNPSSEWVNSSPAKVLS